MKKIHLINSKAQLTQLDFELFETDRKIIFPLTYKKFLLTNNGGRPKENIFWDGKLELNVSFFYPLKYGDIKIEDILDVTNSNGILQEGYLPFASTGGAGDYAISLKKGDLDAVYLFNYDGSVPLKISDSFEDFINNLEEA